MEKMKILTPIKAIRKKCLDCSNGQYLEVRNCLDTDCPLYVYRLGKRPKNKDIQLKVESLS
jgi:hypothetical protein